MLDSDVDNYCSSDNSRRASDREFLAIAAVEDVIQTQIIILAIAAVRLEA